MGIVRIGRAPNAPKDAFMILGSQLLNNGVDILVASKRLGHAKPSITLDVYGHLLSFINSGVANKIEELVS